MRMKEHFLLERALVSIKLLALRWFRRTLDATKHFTCISYQNHIIWSVVIVPISRVGWHRFDSQICFIRQKIAMTQHRDSDTVQVAVYLTPKVADLSTAISGHDLAKEMSLLKSLLSR